MASLTRRSPVESEVLFTNLFPIAIVVEPPPSRLIAPVAEDFLGCVSEFDPAVLY